MKKFICIFLCVLFFFIIFSCDFSANEISDTEFAFREAFSLDEIENIPEESYENAEIFGEELTVENTSAFLDAGKIFSFILDVISAVISSKKGYILTLISILFLSFFAHHLGQGLSSEKTLSTVRNITVLLTAVSVFFPLWSSISDCMVYGETLSSFSLSLMPVFVSLSTASGTPSAALGNYSVVFFSVEFFSWLLAAVVPIFVSVFLSSGIASGFSEDDGMKKLSSAARNIIIAVMTFVYFLLTTISSLQSGILSGADSVAKKGLKFVVNSGVPVAGGFLSDGMDSVYATAEALKKNCGGFAVVVIFLVAVSPVIELVFCGICMKICASVSSFFKNSSLENFFSVSFDAYLVALSFILGYFVTVSVLILIMMNAGG